MTKREFKEINYAAYYEGVLIAEVTVYDSTESNDMLLYFLKKYSFCSIDKDFD